MMVLTSFKNRLTLAVFRLHPLRLGYFIHNVSWSCFTLVTLLNGLNLAFRSDVISKVVLCHDDTSLPRLLGFSPRFTGAGHVCMLIKGYIYHLCGETPTDLRMGVPTPATSFVGLSLSLTETQRKATTNAPYK
jgi:hypothetical protein